MPYANMVSPRRSLPQGQLNALQLLLLSLVNLFFFAVSCFLFSLMIFLSLALNILCLRDSSYCFGLRAVTAAIAHCMAESKLLILDSFP